MRESFVRERAALHGRRAVQRGRRRTTSRRRPSRSSRRSTSWRRSATPRRRRSRRWSRRARRGGRTSARRNAAEVVKARGTHAGGGACEGRGGVATRTRAPARVHRAREGADGARARTARGVRGALARGVGRERTSLVAQLEETAAQWKAEHKKLVAANAFQKAADAIVWEKKVAKARDEAETRVAQARDEGEAKPGARTRRRSGAWRRLFASATTCSRGEPSRRTGARARAGAPSSTRRRWRTANRKLEAARGIEEAPGGARRGALGGGRGGANARGGCSFRGRVAIRGEGRQGVRRDGARDAERAVLAGREEVNAESRLCARRTRRGFRRRRSSSRRSGGATPRRTAPRTRRRKRARRRLEEASAAVGRGRAPRRADAARTFSRRSSCATGGCGRGVRARARARPPSPRAEARRGGGRSARRSWRGTAVAAVLGRSQSERGARGASRRGGSAWRRALAERDRRECGDRQRLVRVRFAAEGDAAMGASGLGAVRGRRGRPPRRGEPPRRRRRGEGARARSPLGRRT